jgi:hypothetical protein
LKKIHDEKEYMNIKKNTQLIQRIFFPLLKPLLEFFAPPKATGWPKPDP